MPVWLKEFGPALLALLKGAISSLGYFAAYVSGRRYQRTKQLETDKDAVSRAIRASDNAALDDDSLRQSPHNRDS